MKTVEIKGCIFRAHFTFSGKNQTHKAMRRLAYCCCRDFKKCTHFQFSSRNSLVLLTAMPVLAKWLLEFICKIVQMPVLELTPWKPGSPFFCQHAFSMSCCVCVSSARPQPSSFHLYWGCVGDIATKLLATVTAVPAAVTQEPAVALAVRQASRRLFFQDPPEGFLFLQAPHHGTVVPRMPGLESRTPSPSTKMLPVAFERCLPHADPAVQLPTKNNTKASLNKDQLFEWQIRTSQWTSNALSNYVQICDRISV